MKKLSAIIDLIASLQTKTYDIRIYDIYLDLKYGSPHDQQVMTSKFFLIDDQFSSHETEYTVCR